MLQAQQKEDTVGMLSGKRALVIGVASKLSIAYGIADALHREGCDLAFTYQNDKLKDRVLGFAEGWGTPASRCFPCDVASDADINHAFVELASQWDGLDILIHCVAFAPGDQLAGRFVDVTTREGFHVAHDISAYSLIGVTRAAQPLMSGRAGSIITLSYLGAVQTMPNYNVMGLAKASLEAGVRYLATSLGPVGHRVNAISAGPIRTLAASGIKDFRSMLAYNASRTPLRRNTTIEEVGNTAAFLGSDLASGITGQVIYVDNGFSITAMGESDNA
jgi:enoyl-[acyl-carrier protein] reductase I